MRSHGVMKMETETYYARLYCPNCGDRHSAYFEDEARRSHEAGTKELGGIMCKNPDCFAIFTATVHLEIDDYGAPRRRITNARLVRMIQ